MIEEDNFIVNLNAQFMFEKNRSKPTTRPEVMEKSELISKFGPPKKVGTELFG